METTPIRIYGPWRAGWALAWHTLACVPRPDGSFDTTRSEVGEALFQLKYRNRHDQFEPLADTAAGFIRTLRVLPYIRALIPIPPSDLTRSCQPVLELARRIGEKVSLVVPADYLLKVKETPSLKNIDDAEERHHHLENAFQIVDERYRGASVLGFDDLFRSGETLSEVCRTLSAQGHVDRLYVVTLTRTRTKR